MNAAKEGVMVGGKTQNKLGRICIQMPVKVLFLTYMNTLEKHLGTFLHLIIYWSIERPFGGGRV